MEALPPGKPASAVYQDGPFLWLHASYLVSLGINDPTPDLIVKVLGPAPDGKRNAVSGNIEHLYELQGWDETRRRWWCEHACCFTSDLPVAGDEWIEAVQPLNEPEKPSGTYQPWNEPSPKDPWPDSA